MRFLTLALLVFLIGITYQQSAFALRMEQIGPADPKHGVIPQPGWPVHLNKLFEHQSRVYALNTNGEDVQYFKCDVDQIQTMIDLYARVRCRDHEVSLKIGTPTVSSFKNKKFEYNVEVYQPSEMRRAVDAMQGKSGVNTYDPRLTITLPNDSAGEILAKLKFAPHLILKNEIKGSKLPSRATKPERSQRFAKILFDDDMPATNWEEEIFTQVTMWNKESEHGIYLGKVDIRGQFQVPLSNQELIQMTKNEIWLTMTVSDWQTKTKKDHPKLSVAKLARDPGSANPVHLKKEKMK